MELKNLMTWETDLSVPIIFDQKKSKLKFVKNTKKREFDQTTN
jgi:hypothetical protein